MSSYTILNLTQHKASKEQLETGVFDITNTQTKTQLVNALTFNNVPTSREMQICAETVSSIAKECATNTKKVMIGGAPFFMPVLERALIRVGFLPLYAFSRRESTEITKEDGTVAKVSIFKHIGFVGDNL